MIIEFNNNNNNNCKMDLCTSQDSRCKAHQCLFIVFKGVLHSFIDQNAKLIYKAWNGDCPMMINDKENFKMPKVKYELRIFKLLLYCDRCGLKKYISSI